MPVSSHPFKSPSSVSSKAAPSSSCWSSGSSGAFLMQYLPSFWRAGATSQSLTGTSTMRSHSRESAEHRSPSSRSITCVTLFHTSVHVFKHNKMFPLNTRLCKLNCPGLQQVNTVDCRERTVSMLCRNTDDLRQVKSSNNKNANN